MKQIKYVGVKEDGETAFGHMTGGIVWYPGSTHEIKDDIAAKMLQHPDVFAIDEQATAAEPVKSTKTQAIAVNADGLSLAPGGTVADSNLSPAKQSADYQITLKDGSVKALDGMSIDALRQLSKEMGLTPHNKAKQPGLMSKLVEAFPVKTEK